MPLLVFAVASVTACATPSPYRELSCSSSSAPVLQTVDGDRKSTTLSVLTYNIEGLGFPARAGRAANLRKIARHLVELRSEGRAPDVILFQEMFSGAAKRAIADSGYPAIVSGPHRTSAPGKSNKEPLPGRSHIKRGEIGIHLSGSGLAVVSQYPITKVRKQAYGRRSCAGLDCLANKGIMQAQISIPGVPTPIDIYDTHMNSRGASRAPAERNLAAHDRQAQEASQFINDTHDDAFPLIFGGDFNMRHSEPRWESFSRYQDLSLVHRVCADPRSGCDVRMSWDGDEPWMDTQDLQFFWNGDAVSIRPIRVEAMFDGGESGPRLSDHDGFLVTYELSWADRTENRTVGQACVAGSDLTVR